MGGIEAFTVGPGWCGALEREFSEGMCEEK